MRYDKNNNYDQKEWQTHGGSTLQTGDTTKPEDMYKESNYIHRRRKTKDANAMQCDIHIQNIHYLLRKCISIRINNTVACKSCFHCFGVRFDFGFVFVEKIIIFPAIWERYWSPANSLMNTREIVLGFRSDPFRSVCMYVNARNFSTIAQWTKAHILFGWTPKHNMKNVKMIWLREWSQIIMSVVVVVVAKMYKVIWSNIRWSWFRFFFLIDWNEAKWIGMSVSSLSPVSLFSLSECVCAREPLNKHLKNDCEWFRLLSSVTVNSHLSTKSNREEKKSISSDYHSRSHAHQIGKFVLGFLASMHKISQITFQIPPKQFRFVSMISSEAFFFHSIHGRTDHLAFDRFHLRRDRLLSSC